MYNRETFAERLKELRKLTGKTQKVFAESVGSTPATISAYENADKNPSLDIVANIASVYEVSLDWLSGIGDNKIPKIQTYRDVAKFFLGLDETMLQFEISKKETETLKSNDDFNCICFNDWRICEFLEQWEKMSSLKGKAMIDEQVYSFWLESTLSKLNDKVDRWDDIIQKDNFAPNPDSDKSK